MYVMKKAIPHNLVLALVLAGSFILLDVTLDRFLGDSDRLDWPHLILATSVLMISYTLLSRAMNARVSAEAVLRQARDEMENQVRERTAELEQVNQALRTSEETARALMNASSESALLLDAQGNILAANEISAQRLGAPVKRLLGSSLFSFFPPEVAERRRVYLDTIQQSGQPVHFIDERSGRTYDSHVYPIRDADGRIVRLAAFSQDITERMQAEEALRASEEKYRLLFQNMAEGFALYELLYDDKGEPADWRILEVNDAYTQHTGIAHDRAVGHRISELFPAAIPEYLPRFSDVVATQTPMEFETYAKAVGRHQRVITFPAGGHRFASTIDDITERKQSEEALRQAQAEMALAAQIRVAQEERQRLARELHDSVSQALYGISLGINTALTLFETDRAKVLEALNYALSLAHAGLTEMRALIFELRPESLAIEGLVVALSKQIAAIRVCYGIEVEMNVCNEPDVPLAVKEPLYRIAQEALQNAVKHSHANRLDVRFTREPEGLSLEVCDDGVGFDPLAAYPGHLGLRSMRERAVSAGGTLDIVSAPGSGAQIHVRIPFAASE
jgi:PAS domain S-box-containing protein